MNFADSLDTRMTGRGAVPTEVANLRRAGAIPAMPLPGGWNDLRAALDEADAGPAEVATVQTVWKAYRRYLSSLGELPETPKARQGGSCGSWRVCDVGGGPDDVSRPRRVRDGGGRPGPDPAVHPGAQAAPGGAADQREGVGVVRGPGLAEPGGQRAADRVPDL